MGLAMTQVFATGGEQLFSLLSHFLNRSFSGNITLWAPRHSGLCRSVCLLGESSQWHCAAWQCFMLNVLFYYYAGIVKGKWDIGRNAFSFHGFVALDCG